MQKNEILVQTALVMGGFWTIQKITPKSPLMYWPPKVYIPTPCHDWKRKGVHSVID